MRSPSVTSSLSLAKPGLAFCDADPVRDVLHVGVRQSRGEALHDRAGALARLELLQLLDQVFGMLLRQLGIGRYGRIAVRVMARRAHRREFGLRPGPDRAWRPPAQRRAQPRCGGLFLRGEDRTRRALPGRQPSCRQASNFIFEGLFVGAKACDSTMRTRASPHSKRRFMTSPTGQRPGSHSANTSTGRRQRHPRRSPSPGCTPRAS